MRIAEFPNDLREQKRLTREIGRKALVQVQNRYSPRLMAAAPSAEPRAQTCHRRARSCLGREVATVSRTALRRYSGRFPNSRSAALSAALAAGRNAALQVTPEERSIQENGGNS